MSVQTKNVSGQLLDMERKSVLAEISVVIALVQPQNTDDRPQYQITAMVKGYRPELDNKSHILKLSEMISGEVFISITGIPDMSQTQFTVFLQDSVWNDVHWFQSL